MAVVFRGQEKDLLDENGTRVVGNNDNGGPVFVIVLLLPR